MKKQKYSKVNLKKTIDNMSDIMKQALNDLSAEREIALYQIDGLETKENGGSKPLN